MNKFRKFYLYRKLVFSFLTISIISIGFMGMIFYILFSNSIKSELQHLSTKNLSQVNFSINKVYENNFPVVNNILNLNYINSVLLDSEVNRVHEFYVLRQLQSLEAAYEQIRFIGLRNIETNRYVGTRGVYTSQEDNLRFLKEQKIYSGMNCIPRTVRKNNNIDFSEELNVISFIYYPSDRYTNGYIVIDIEQSYFKEILSSSINKGQRDHIFILSSENDLIVSSDSKYAEIDFSMIDQKEIFSENKNSGYFIQEINGISQFVSYIKSDVANWYIISLKPYDELMASTNSIRDKVFLIIILLIIIDLAFTFFFTRFIYSPLDGMLSKLREVTNPKLSKSQKVDEIKVLHGALLDYAKKTDFLKDYQQKSIDVLKDYWLRALFLDEFELSNENSEIVNFCNFDLSKRYFCVVVIAIDNYNIFEKRYDEKDKQLYKFAIANISNELLSDYCVGELVWIDKGKSALLINTDSVELSNNIFVAIEELQDTILKYFDISLSVCYGNTEMHLKDVPRSSMKAQEGLRKRLYLGNGGIINATADYSRTKNTKYPYKLDKLIKEAINTRNAERAKDVIDSFVQELKRMKVDEITKYSMHFIESLYNESFIDNEPKKQTETLRKVQRNINQAESMHDIYSIIEHFVLEVIDKSKMKEKDFKDSHNAIKFAIQCIKDNYSDPNLSVAYLADEVDLTPTYFGHIFYEEENITCNDFIKKIRMENSAKMLRETDETIKNISKKVGILNTNYFYSLFKKEFGVTPAQFRKDNK